MKKLFSVRTIILAGSFLLQLNTLCFQSRGAAGDVDLAFDPGSGVNGNVFKVVAQPDGKVLISGDFTTVKGLARSGIARLNADGSGDPTFNAGAVCVADIALQPDGKILTCCDSAVRLNSDGTLDGSFIAETGPDPYAGTVYGNTFTSVVVQPDGKVLLGGYSFDYFVDWDGSIYYYQVPLLIRLNADGTSDPGFAPAVGSFAAFFDAYIRSVTLQPDGKVLILGSFSVANGAPARIARFNADGSLDSTFNPGTGPNNDVYYVSAQANGKVLLGGLFTTINGTNRNRIARLNANGSLDTSFNPGTGVSGANRVVDSIAVQADGKVLIGGIIDTVSGASRNGIARLNANGTLDTSFNPGTGVQIVGGYLGGIRSLALQVDGKVLIGGGFATVNGTSRDNLARLNANGSLDGTFNPGTGISIGAEGAIDSVVEQPDGKVLIGGRLTTVRGTSRNGIARLNVDGSLDSSFNPGTGVANYYSNYRVASIALQPDGKVLIGGYFTEVNGTSRVSLARLNANGSLDNTFNPGISPNGSVHSIALQSDGKVLVGDTQGLSRLNANGTLDNGFHPDTGVSYYGAMALAVQADGKLLVGGFAPVTITNPVYGDYTVLAALLTRLNGDGSRDTSFESALEEEFVGDQYGQAPVAVQPDGKVLFGGYFSTLKGAPRNQIGRLHADGTLDTSFDPGSGVAGTSGLYDGFNGVSSIAVQPDGKVLIAGSFSVVNGTNRSGIARLNANGSLDSSFYPGTGADGVVTSVALQSDGNVLIGGNFTTVNGVARSYVARLYGASAPSLNITRSNASVILSWPVTGLNFQLQETTNLFPAAWSPVAQPSVTNSNQVSVTVPTTAQRKFFRLISP